MSETTARPGQGRFVAPVEETPVLATDRVDESAPPTSLWGDAWRTLRKRPLFIVASLIVLLLLVVAVRPQLFTSVDPAYCTLDNSLAGPSAGHLFGFDRQGCDIYSRVVFGARASIVVGVLATSISVVVGGVLGAFAGYYGGWLDAIISRVSDIFFAIPLLLAAITGMQAFDERTSLVVALVLAAFGWPQVARIMRGSVLSVRGAEYVTAATALGSSKLANLGRHVLPNAIAPVIVIATINLGVYIAAEATLSFLGIGLAQTIVSWGGDINRAQASLRQNVGVLLYPAGALSLTVLSFIMLGDAVRDALDPKGRTR